MREVETSKEKERDIRETTVCLGLQEIERENKKGNGMMILNDRESKGNGKSRGNQTELVMFSPAFSQIVLIRER